jgi:hypothetical protein
MRWSGYICAYSREGEGLAATYYDASSFTTPVRAVGLAGAGSVDFSASAGVVRAGMSLSEPSDYAVRWSGFVKPCYAGTYTFITPLRALTDRVRLWVDTELLIDQWSSLAATAPSATRAMAVKQKFYPIQVICCVCLDSCLVTHVGVLLHEPCLQFMHGLSVCYCPDCCFVDNALTSIIRHRGNMSPHIPASLNNLLKQNKRPDTNEKKLRQTV